MVSRPDGKDLDLAVGNDLAGDASGEPGAERQAPGRGGRSSRRGRPGGAKSGGKPGGQPGGRGGQNQRRRKGSQPNSNPPAAAEKLSSPQNPQVKSLVRLRQRRTRDQEGLTIIEEPLVLRRAWEAGYPLHAVYFCPELMTPPARELLEDLRAALQVGQTSLKLVELSADLLRKAAYRDQPEGILAVAPQQRRHLEDLVLRDNPLLVVLENVEKPGNLGAALRIADGVGADAVLVTGEGTDLFNPNVLRASRGAFFSVPAVHCHIGEARDFLHERGLKVLASTPTATAIYTTADLTGPIAVVLGCEHDGLSEAWLKDEGCQAVRIPMRGHGDSLNVATAAAVILYEAVRQRSPA
jgi:RNA methyltransferase, TrmH family